MKWCHTQEVCDLNTQCPMLAMLHTIIISSLLTMSCYHSMLCAGNAAFHYYHRLIMLSSLTAVCWQWEACVLCLRATWHTVNHHYHSLINGANIKCNVSNEMSKGVKWTPLYSPNCLQWMRNITKTCVPTEHLRTLNTYSIFRHIHTIVKATLSLVMSIRLSVGLNRAIWLPLDGFSWNLIQGFFKNLSRKFKFH
jgi:hypothetical protein